MFATVFLVGCRLHLGWAFFSALGSCIFSGQKGRVCDVFGSVWIFLMVLSAFGV